MKPWTPEIVRPSATYLHEQYGISEKRRIYLSDQMTSFCNVTTTQIVPVANHIDRIAAMADNANEFAFCVFIHAAWLNQTNKLLT